MHSVLKYTAARVLLFVATLGVVYLLGARGLLAIALAVLISGLVSFVLLARQRDAVSSSLTSGASGLRRRMAEGAAREDDT